jgi:hypothetical protein
VNFAPYHTFAACLALERQVKALRAAGFVPDNIMERHEVYHYSIIHKLRSAKYHVETLQNYLNTHSSAQTSPEDIVYRVNFHFDGFLHVVGSAMDIFAREVLTYFGQNLPPKVYFRTAREVLTASRAGDPILAFLETPSWQQEFADYRNTATHESLVGTGYSIAITMQGSSASQRLSFPIPDDPRAIVKTYNRNKDIVKYCGTSFKRVLSLFNQGYNHLTIRVKAAGVLPL